MTVSGKRFPGFFACLLAVLGALFAVGGAVAGEPGGTVRGCIQTEGQQPATGVASLWDASNGRIPDPRRFIIIPTAVAILQADGCFVLQAPPGRYYVGSVLRQTPGLAMGPPRPGDLVFMTPARDGSALQVELAAGATVDVGLRTDGWAYEGFSGEVETGLSGRVLDAEGRPVAGLLVFAFGDAEMSGAPLAVSERTGADGTFLLRLDRPGEVWLRVKDDYGGGAPQASGYVGVYGGDTPKPVSARAGVVAENLEIPVFRLPENLGGRRGLHKATP